MSERKPDPDGIRAAANALYEKTTRLNHDPPFEELREEYRKLLIDTAGEVVQAYLDALPPS